MQAQKGSRGLTAIMPNLGAIRRGDRLKYNRHIYSLPQKTNMERSGYFFKKRPLATNNIKITTLPEKIIYHYSVWMAGSYIRFIAGTNNNS
jgi:hypothetical protein